MKTLTKPPAWFWLIGLLGLLWNLLGVAAFVNDVPYAPAVIALDEGIRVLSHVVDCPPEELAIDLLVEAVFEEVTREVILPKFRRV